MVTSKKSTKLTKQNGIIIGVIVAIIAIAIIITIIVLSINRSSGDPNINQSFFESDDSKYVISYTMTPPEEITEDTIGTDTEGTVSTTSYNSDLSPIAIHNVYYHEGNTITGLQAYYEFKTAELAKEAFDSYYHTLADSDIESVSVDGKYIILTSNPDNYADITLDYLKQWYDYDAENSSNANSEANTEAGTETNTETSPETTTETNAES